MRIILLVSLIFFTVHDCNSCNRHLVMKFMIYNYFHVKHPTSVNLYLDLNNLGAQFILYHQLGWSLPVALRGTVRNVMRERKWFLWVTPLGPGGNNTHQEPPSDTLVMFPWEKFTRKHIFSRIVVYYCNNRPINGSPKLFRRSRQRAMTARVQICISHSKCGRCYPFYSGTSCSYPVC